MTGNCHVDVSGVGAAHAAVSDRAGGAHDAGAGDDATRDLQARWRSRPATRLGPGRATHGPDASSAATPLADAGRRPAARPSADSRSSTLLLVDVALLCVIGLVMVGSASSVISISIYGSPWAILIREGMWMAIGVVALCAGHPRRLPQAAPVSARSCLLVTFGLLFVVLVPGPRACTPWDRAAGSASGSSGCSPPS